MAHSECKPLVPSSKRSREASKQTITIFLPILAEYDRGKAKAGTHERVVGSKTITTMLSVGALEA